MSEFHKASCPRKDIYETREQFIARVTECLIKAGYFYQADTFAAQAGKTTSLVELDYLAFDFIYDPEEDVLDMIRWNAESGQEL